MEPEMCIWVRGEAGECTGARSGPQIGVQVVRRSLNWEVEVARVPQRIHEHTHAYAHTCSMCTPTHIHPIPDCTAARHCYDQSIARTHTSIARHTHTS
eukprot:2249167-Rhodomonas_salina.1